MKKKIALGLFALSMFVTGTSTLHAQPAFEGTIEWTMLIPKSDPGKHPMIISVKGAKSIMEMDMGKMGKMHIYKDADAKKTYMLMDRQHSAQELPYIEDAASATPTPNLDLKPTGSSAVIGGHNAQEYLVKSDQGDVSLWVSSDFPKDIQENCMRAVKSSSRRNNPILSQTLRQFAEKGMCPVKIEWREGSATKMTMEFVKFEHKKLDDSIFALPAEVHSLHPQQTR